MFSFGVFSSFLYWLACLPDGIFLRQADGARAVAGGDSGGFIEEEHAVLYVPSAGNGTQRGTTVEKTVELVAPMATEGARYQTPVRLAILSDQREGFRLSQRGRPPVTTAYRGTTTPRRCARHRVRG